MAYLRHQRNEYMEAWANDAFEEGDTNEVAKAKCLAYQEVMALEAHHVEPSLMNLAEGAENE